MHTFRTLSVGELSAAYETVFREAFPPEELKPLGSIRAMSEGGFYRACGLFDGGEPLAYICLWSDENYILIDYLCVPRDRRGGGYGAEMLRAAREAYPPESVFFAEVEAPTGDEESDRVIFRRLGFYERSGARQLDYDCALFGVHYKMIAWCGEEADSDEIMRRHEGLYRRWFSPQTYDRAIQIPLRPGDKIFDRKVWDERPGSEEQP